MDLQSVINSLRDRGRKMVALDNPQDQDWYDIGADIGAGFLPGVGQVQAGRDFERARREGDKFGMGLSAFGMIPFVGGLRAAGKVGRAAKKAAKPNLARDGVPIKDLTDAEKRWGNGEKIFAFHEMDEAPSLVTSLEMLNNYQPDQLMALPKKAAPAAPVAQQIPDALRSGKKASPGAARMSAAEARAAGYWHPVGLGKKLDRPYQDMTFTHEQVKDLPQRKTISLEDLKGQYIIPAAGDRTAAGKLLTEVDGTKLENPVMLEGGPDFMLTHSKAGDPESSIWASGQSVSSKLRNRAVAAEKESGGAAANLLYVPMGHNSLNFSTMPVDTALEMIRSGKISKKAKAKFDDAVRTFRPDFAGVSSPEAIAQLRGSGAMRHAFLDRMQLDPFRQEGFPDLAAIRKAIMEPSIADVPNYHGGYSIGRVDTTKPLLKNPSNPHSTYNTQIPGQVVGGLDVAIPHEELWHDFFAQRRERGMPESGDRMAFERASPAQLIDQRTLDRLMPLVEALRKNRQ